VFDTKEKADRPAKCGVDRGAADPPDYDELLKSFWETRGTWEQANGGSRHLPEAALEPLIGRN